MIDIVKQDKVLELAREFYNSQCKTGEYKKSGIPVIGFWHSAENFGVLSNWYMANFEMSGIRFNCMEQLIMYGKAITFEDYAVANKVLEESNPKNMKRFGRMVRGFNESTWESARDAWTLEGLVDKFCQLPKAEKVLLDTGHYLIAEASPYDGIWGIGIGTDYCYDDISNWRGRNLLGQYLMSVRYGLQNYSREC